MILVRSRFERVTYDRTHITSTYSMYRAANMMVHELKPSVVVERCLQRIFCSDVVEKILGFLRPNPLTTYYVQKNEGGYELTTSVRAHVVDAIPMHGLKIFYSGKTNVVVSGGGVHNIRVHHAMVEFCDEIARLGLPIIVKDNSGHNRIVEPQILDGVVTGKYYVPEPEAVGWGFYNKNQVVKGCRLTAYTFQKFVGFVDCPDLIREMLHGARKDDYHKMEIYLCTKEGWSKESSQRWLDAHKMGTFDYFVNEVQWSRQKWRNVHKPGTFDYLMNEFRLSPNPK